MHISYFEGKKGWGGVREGGKCGEFFFLIFFNFKGVQGKVLIVVVVVLRKFCVLTHFVMRISKHLV